jgi:hypothetical protein
MPQKSFHPPSSKHTFLRLIYYTMTTPSTATPAAIAFRDKALSTFKSSMDVKDPKEPNASLVLLALAAGYCVRLFLFILSKSSNF